MRSRSAALIFLVFSLTMAPALASTSSLTVEVVDFTGPLPGAFVMVTPTIFEVRSGLTNKHGITEVGDLPPVRCWLEVRFPGMETDRTEIDLRPGPANSIKVVLVPYRREALALSDGAHLSDGPDDETDALAWERLERALPVLWNGSREEKLTVATDSMPGAGFEALEYTPAEREGDREAALQDLLGFLSSEDDTWIVDRLVETLSWEYQIPHGFFLTLLEHPLATVRLRALEGLSQTVEELSDEGIDSLTAIWKSEARPSHLILLLEILETESEGARLIERCKKLIHDDNLELAAGCLDLLADPSYDCEAVLLGVATDPEAQLRSRALRRLHDLKHGEERGEAIATLINAASDPDPRTRMAALVGLNRFPDQRALEVLLAKSTDAREHPTVRCKAELAVMDLCRDGVLTRCEGHRHDPVPTDEMNRITDPITGPGMLQIDPATIPPLPCEPDELNALDAPAPHEKRIAAATERTGRATCLDEPGVPSWGRSLPDGFSISFVWDEFETADGEVWLEVGGLGREDICWVEERHVVWAGAE